MFKKLSLLPRLLLILGVSLVMVLVLSVTALISISQVNDSLDEVYSEHMRPSSLSARLTQNVEQELTQLLLLLQHDPKSEFLSLHDHPISFHTDHIAQVRHDNQNVLDQLEGIQLNDNEARLLKSSREKLELFYQASTETSLQMDQNQFYQANERIITKVSPAAVALTQDLNQLTDTVLASAEQKNLEAKQQYSDIIKLFILIIIVGSTLMIALVYMVIRSITRPVAQAVKIAEKIAEGDFDIEIDTSATDEVGQVMSALDSAVTAVHNMSVEVQGLAQAAVEGRLETRADITPYQGEYRSIVEGFNNTLDAVIGPLNVAAEYVDHIAQGNIPARITDNYNGDFNILKNNLNTCIDAINALIADANLLAQAAVEGRLDTRADASAHQGDYRRIVEGVNDTLDNVVGPLNDVCRVLNAMEQGDLTQTITAHYNGDFDELKQVINNTIAKLADTIGQINAAADSLNSAAAQVSATAQALSQSSSEQAASVEETTSSMEQMTANINQNSENATVTDNMATSAAVQAQEGGEAVKATVQAMNQNEPDRRQNRHYRRHCLPDQPAGPQRRD